MTSGGAEALKAAVRRSLLPVLTLVALGAVAVNVFEQVKGPRYSASARVLISSTPISRIITGTEPPFVDPQRVEDTERALAGSPAVYRRAAKSTGGRLGTASELREATSVGGGRTDILVFTATTSDRRKAVEIANAVAAEYIAWRADISGAAVRKTIAQLRLRLRRLARDDPSRGDLRQQLHRLELLQALNAGDAVLVARAAAAEKKSPAPVRDSLLGAAVGLVVGLLLAAARETIDTKVRSESDVENVLAVPVLATVRSLPRRARMVTYGRHERLFADTYALLAANLVQACESSKPTVIAVTSAVPKEGKTTTAANLAVALARRGAHVLLADFDFRKPALGELFQIPRAAPGVLQIITGASRLSRALWWVSLDGVRPTVGRDEEMRTEGDGRTPFRAGRRGPGSLHVLPAGVAVRAQAIVHSPRLATLVQGLRSQYDFVILDTPPALLTIEMTELGRVIDVVLLVVRQGRVTLRSLRSLGKQAQNWPAELVGAVLTDAPAQEAYASYYGGR